MAEKPFASSLSHSDTKGVTLRGKDLVTEVMGHMTFTETLYLMVVGKAPTVGQARILDAVLVTLMDHGLTPHALTARMIYYAAPESIQGAMAAGLLGVGGQVAGTMDGSAKLIARLVEAEDQAKEAEAIVNDHRLRRAPLPGFGHIHHKPDDPRSPRLFTIAEETGVSGRYIAALKLLGRTLDRIQGKHITINATGAIAAVLLEIEFPAPIHRGVAVISRAGGLLAQLNEERERRIVPDLLTMIRSQVDYDGG